MARPLRETTDLRARRSLARTAGAVWALATALLLCSAALAAAAAASVPAAAEPRDPGVWRGVICTSPSCRPASRWDAAAFAVAAVTLGWLARRRPSATS